MPASKLVLVPCSTPPDGPEIALKNYKNTPNCNKVVIEKKQKAKKANRNKLAMGFTFAYFNSVFNNYLTIHSQ